MKKLNIARLSALTLAISAGSAFATTQSQLWFNQSWTTLSAGLSSASESGTKVTLTEGVWQSSGGTAEDNTIATLTADSSGTAIKIDANVDSQLLTFTPNSVEAKAAAGVIANKVTASLTFESAYDSLSKLDTEGIKAGLALVKETGDATAFVAYFDGTAWQKSSVAVADSDYSKPIAVEVTTVYTNKDTNPVTYDYAMTYKIGDTTLSSVSKAGVAAKISAIAMTGYGAVDTVTSDYQFDAKAKIGDVYYATLEEALAAAKDDSSKTVELTENATPSDGSFAGVGAYKILAKGYTVNFGGLTGNYKYARSGDEETGYTYKFEFLGEADFVAQIGEESEGSKDDNKYVSLAAALAAAANGDTITVIDGVTSLPGFNVDKNKKVTIDLNGQTVALTTDYAGISTNDVSYAARSLAGSEVTITNGTLAVAKIESENNRLINVFRSFGAKFTLADATIDGTNLRAGEGGKTTALRMINGSTELINSTITAKTNEWAFQMGNHASSGYVVGTFTVDATSTVTGDILLQGGTFAPADDCTITGDYYFGAVAQTTYTNQVAFVARSAELVDATGDSSVSTNAGRLFRTMADALASDATTIYVSGANAALADGATLTKATTFAVEEGATLALASGTLNAAYDLTVTGAGSLSIAGTLKLGEGVTVDLSALAYAQSTAAGAFDFGFKASTLKLVKDATINPNNFESMFLNPVENAKVIETAKTYTYTGSTWDDGSVAEYAINFTGAGAIGGVTVLTNGVAVMSVSGKTGDKITVTLADANKKLPIFYMDGTKCESSVELTIGSADAAVAFTAVDAAADDAEIADADREAAVVDTMTEGLGTDDAAAVEQKIATISGEGSANAKAVATWIENSNGAITGTKIAASSTVEASFALGTDQLIANDANVDVETFSTDAEGKLEVVFEIKNGEDPVAVAASAAEEAAELVVCSEDLAFGTTIEATKTATINTTTKKITVKVTPPSGKTKAFMKVRVNTDAAK